VYRRWRGQLASQKWRADVDDVEEVAVATRTMSGQDRGEFAELARWPRRPGGRYRSTSVETTPIYPGGRITQIPVFFGAGVTADEVKHR